MPLRTLVLSLLFLACSLISLLGQDAERRVNYELFVYDVPHPKVELVIPIGWNADWSKLALGDAREQQQAQLMLEAIAISTVDFKVDGRPLVSPSPTVVPLIEEERGYVPAKATNQATHYGMSWVLTEPVKLGVEVLLHKEIFGSKGLYQGHLESKSGKTGLIDTHPAQILFEMQTQSKLAKIVPSVQSQLYSFKVSNGPSPRVVLWFFLGLLVLIIQVRKSRSVSNKGTAIAMAVLTILLALWLWLSPRIDYQKLSAKMPKDKVLESKKRKEAGQWMEYFFRALSQPQNPNAASYLAAASSANVVDGFTIEAYSGRPWKLLSFAAEKQEDAQANEATPSAYLYQWTATSENWVWGQSDLKVMGGTFEVAVEGQKVKAQLPQIKMLDLAPRPIQAQ